jgi:glycosidase
MPNSIFDPAVQTALVQARAGSGALFPSPADWRDAPIYFLMMDRFNNPQAPPRSLPFDASFNQFQGGTFEGVRSRLQYIQDLGFGAIWLSPVLKNPQFDNNAYHGYGIQNFLAVEPRFASAPGREEVEFRRLVDDAHQIGLYIILDIVLHHAGNVFEYAISSGSGVTEVDSLDWTNSVQPIRWRDVSGTGNPSWSDAPPAPPLDAAVWPGELRHNALFTRQGNSQSPGGQPAGDFDSLKGISFNFPGPGLNAAQDILIRAYQYIVAKFDVDGFRIDTLKFIPADFERIFANAMREFGMSAGKKNFFTFGEVYDDESTIAQFIGRNTSATETVVGVDAALDYPLFFQFPLMVKGLGPTPADVAGVFENRKRVEKDILTSHGEAGQYFVTFLDNHDQPQRFGYTGPTQLTDQIVLGLGLLFGLPGIPCVYYGTEQGLAGHKTNQNKDDSMVREALWGKTGGGQSIGFDVSHPLYVALKALGQVRRDQPALRYGRYYFRPLSGDGTNFGLSTFQTGVLAFSRILNDQEVIVVGNTIPQGSFAGEVLVDFNINGPIQPIVCCSATKATRERVPAPSC